MAVNLDSSVATGPFVTFGGRITYIIAMLKHLLLLHEPTLAVWPEISERSSHESNRVLYSIVWQPSLDCLTHCCKEIAVRRT